MPRPTERIYVGGLDPTRGLTVDLVASRLRAVPDVEILSVDDVPSKNSLIDDNGERVDDRRFFFVEARRTDDDRDSSSSASALRLLADQYHNANWKGCRLRIEEARPHFLRRLETERADRRRRTLVEEASPRNENDERPTTTTPACAKQRRRLRIRKRFGEEAYQVDTQPQIVEMNSFTGGEWEAFDALYRKMNHKRLSQWKKLLERRKEERRRWSSGGGGRDAMEKKRGEEEDNEGWRGALFLNRGIHVRFRDGDGGGGVERVGLDECNGDEDGWGKAEVDSTSCSEAHDSDDVDHRDTKEYVWSDEEEDASRSSELNSKDDGSSSNREQGNIGHDYIWSDEESDERHHVKNDGSEFRIKSKNGMEEFSGGIQIHDDDSTNNSSEQSNEHSDENYSHHDNSDEGAIRLEEDIRSNLGILSKLFPEEQISIEPLASTESTVKTLQAGNGDGTKDGANIRNPTAFRGGLIIQRYDPTKEDGALSQEKTRKLSVDEAKHDNEMMEGQVSGTTSESNDDIQNHVVETQETQHTSFKDSNDKDKMHNFPERTIDEQSKPEVPSQDLTRNDIYEQDKLENIFKQAREQQQGGASTTTGFSFGALFESQMDVTTDVLMESSNPMTSKLPAEDRSNEAVTVDAVSNEPARLESNEPQREARVGLEFPLSVLDEYENLFFSLNEGPRIIADLESIRNDKVIQDQWQKEREVLTADWKRKQKAALSRKVKKVRRF
ncbi:hypothetical protein ACHAW6_005267 [Cyclotella cf. meneghiniana]